MKIIFAGTSEFGIPTLEKLKASASVETSSDRHHELVLVITQPDKPAGRDKKLAPPPVKVWAQKNNIPVEQPEKIKDLGLKLSSLNPDLLLVAAYGQIIPKDILDIPKFGSINIHGSLLPQYRGASPIQSAILNGNQETGITLIKMDDRMDHGPMIAREKIYLTGKEKFPELYKTLSLVSAELVEKTLPDWFAGKITPEEQSHNEASFSKMLTRQDGKITWAQPAAVIDQQIRALNPEPGTWTELKGKVVKILEAEILPDHKIELPGKLYSHNGEVAVKCLDNGLILKRVKLEGKNEISGKDFLNGLQGLNDKLFI